MLRHNLDFGIPLTREQWEQLGESANAREDFGIMRWAPAEFDVIRVAMRSDDAPKGWSELAPTGTERLTPDREVARFVYNDGRPYARLEPPTQPAVPAVTSAGAAQLEVQLERWVRGKWHELLADSGIHFDRGALPADEPNPGH
jgi:hypothetical protein